MSYEGFLAIWLGINLLFATLSAFLASRWGRDPFGWLLIGAVLGPVGLLLLLLERQRGPHAPITTLTSPGARTGGNGSPNVLIAVDGSDVSEQAVRYVIDHFGASLPEVSVIGVLPLERAEGATSEEGSSRKALLEEEVERYLGAACRELRGAGVSCKSMVRFGEPAEEIIQVARELACDLIVMGRRGRGKAAQLVLGSVSSKVTKEAPCPVTVVG